MAPLPSIPSAPLPAIDRRVAALIFALALGLQFWAATQAWNSGGLPGNEFRQAQTALSSLFIQRDHDYSLRYPTPVLGKPWSVPMEFPLYQWSVALTSDLTGKPQVRCARAISLLCFYLTLPAIWIFTRRLGLQISQRFICLSAIISCPISIFYGRAFLIETMALLFAIWFAVGFVETMQQRKGSWLIITNLAGMLAGTVKATTLLVYILPSAVFGAYLLWHHLAAKHDPNRFTALRRTLGWGLACAVGPFLVTLLWTHFADGVKAENPAAAFLTSANLTSFNFGHSLFGERFSLTVWAALLTKWHQGLCALPTLGLVVVTGLIFGSTRIRVGLLSCLFAFVSAQLLFPLLYSIHDYYFTAPAALLMLAVGLSLAGVQVRRYGRWLAPLLVIGFLTSQGWTYYSYYYSPQISAGTGNDLTNRLFELTDDDEVLIIAGDDWNSRIPYFAQRRALMLRFGEEQNESFLREAFAKLADERVAALVLLRGQRNNQTLITLAQQELGIANQPLLEFPDATVYFSKTAMQEIAPADRGQVSDGSGPVAVFGDKMKGVEVDMATLSRRQQRLFKAMKPMPTRFYFEFGPAILNTPDGTLINAHAETRLWFDVPADSTELHVEYGMFDSLWQNDAYQTDGVELQIYRLQPDGTRELLFSRFLDPRNIENDRGLKTLSLPLPDGASLKLLLISDPGPNGQRNFDWFYLRQIRID